ncbi:MAG: hypothetical protein K0Q97_2238 [Bacillota bacterium]|jgi:hypothetical protein|nr:hypothetical protein [Bacillota bacterium]
MTLEEKQIKVFYFDNEEGYDKEYYVQVEKVVDEEGDVLFEFWLCKKQQGIKMFMFALNEELINDTMAETNNDLNTVLEGFIKEDISFFIPQYEENEYNL